MFPVKFVKVENGRFATRAPNLSLYTSAGQDPRNYATLCMFVTLSPIYNEQGLAGARNRRAPKYVNGVST